MLATYDIFRCLEIRKENQKQLSKIEELSLLLLILLVFAHYLLEKENMEEK